MAANQKLNQEWMSALDIKQEDISEAIKAVKDGEGPTVVGYALGLDKHFREVEFNRVLDDLNIYNCAAL